MLVEPGLQQKQCSNTEGFEYSVYLDLKPQVVFVFPFPPQTWDMHYRMGSEGEQPFPESAQQALVFVNRVFSTAKN